MSTFNGKMVTLDDDGLLRSGQGGAYPGFLQAFAGSVAPEGWLLCDGAAVSRVDEARLFSVIGTTYGAGDGSTTFNLPDLRGRVPVGVDGTAARLTANDALGQSGGAEKHTLTQGEIPDHQHQLSVWNGSDGSIGTQFQIEAHVTGHNSSAGFGTGPLSGGVPVADGGGDGPHNNMQPFLIANWLVKT